MESQACDIIEIVEDEDKPKHEGFAPNSFVSNYVTEQQRKTFELTWVSKGVYDV